MIFEKIKTSEIDDVTSSIDQLLYDYDESQKDDEQLRLVRSWDFFCQEKFDEYNEAKNIINKRSISTMNKILDEVISNIELL